MTITNMSNPSTMTGAPVRGSDGEKLGKIDAIYLDNATNAPEWAAVKTGLFGGHNTLVPLAQASWDGDTLTVPFDKQALKTAPHHDPDAEISAADEDELYRHYGLSAGRSASGVDARAGERRDLTGAAGVQGRDTSGPTTDTAMTRSEEQLRVGTQTHEAGPARLRKHVVTEHQQVTVPVSREEVTLERRAGHRRQPQRRLQRPRDLRGGARGHPARRAPGRGRRGRCRRTSAPGQGDGHRPGDGGRRGPQGGDRARPGRHRRRRAARRRAYEPPLTQEQ